MIFKEGSIKAAMQSLTQSKVGILLIDEGTQCPEKTEIMFDEEILNAACYHRNQSEIIILANKLGFPIYITNMLLNSEERLGINHYIVIEELQMQRFDSVPSFLPNVLADVIPGNTPVFNKAPSDSYCANNPALIARLRQDEIEHLVVLGQSRNACCKDTSATIFASIRSMNFLTSPYITRFGDNDVTMKPDWTRCFTAFDSTSDNPTDIQLSGWPTTTTVYTHL